MNHSDNVDAAEVNKFDDMATNWWDPNGSAKPLHLLNPLRVQFIQDACQIKNKQILDIGCGGGLLTEALAKESPHVMGIDQSEKMLNIAKQHSNTHCTHPPEYRLQTAEALQSTHSEYFDVITCFELLEHVPDTLSLVRACSALAKPGADLFFSTINRTPKAFIEAICCAEYVFKMLPKGTHHYSGFIRPSELAHLCRKNNLSVKKIQGVRYQPLLNTFSFSHNTSVNYLLHCIKATS